jgi:hypothetical protein
VFSRARRETGHGGPRVKSDRRRPSSKAVVGVEPLEGRMLLSYLVVVKNHKVIPVHGGDARVAEPLFSNGLAFKKQAHFYQFYTGPKTSNLDGVSATAVVSGNRDTDGILTLSGTVAGPIIAKPTKASQEAIYTFAIDRGGAAKAGPFPGRTHIRFDAVVVVPLTLGGITAANPPYVQLNDASINTPLATTTINLSPSSVKITGDTITITVPLTTGSGSTLTTQIPSTGSAMNQWNVNFFTRFPSPYGSHKNGYHSIASFTPEETMFQVYIQHVTPLRAT